MAKTGQKRCSSSKNKTIDKLNNELNDSLTLQFWSPLSGENPVGCYLYYDTLYSQIREARRQDDDSLSQGIWKTEHKKADWVLVETLTSQALLERSKDLQLVAWLCESWMHLYKFEGILRALELLLNFCQNLWDSMYPELHKELEHRVHIFQWLDKTFAENFLTLPMTQSFESLNIPSYSLADWLMAQDLEKKHKAKSLKDSVQENLRNSLMPRIKKSLSLSTKEWKESTQKNLKECRKHLQSLCSFLDSVCGMHAPTFSQTLKKIEEFEQALTVRDKREENSEQENLKAKPIEDSPDDSEEPSQTEISQDVQRDHAYEALQRISVFLKEKDPHSPTSSLLEIIVGWKDKNLLQIIHDIQKGETEAHGLLRLFATKS